VCAILGMRLHRYGLATAWTRVFVPKHSREGVTKRGETSDRREPAKITTDHLTTSQETLSKATNIVNNIDYCYPGISNAT